ncbi:hypothetical protein [Shouchella lonarensis]|uniref:Uncharacterized protein n=1 Tax=Shouchella lonarensis TaxID=1464122 RepID=A0A1G6MZB5_9BACI|nr:hypothetical protein [Shouchella lonarensis]SDC60929.1 hypothetical protein SAMN05421737_11152 [Shouchella lonarensis]
MTIEEVLQKHEHHLLSIPDVIAIGVGKKNGQDVIQVFVVKKVGELKEAVPHHLEGFLVDVIEAGEITPHV